VEGRNDGVSGVADGVAERGVATGERIQAARPVQLGVFDGNAGFQISAHAQRNLDAEAPVRVELAGVGRRRERGEDPADVVARGGVVGHAHGEGVVH